MLKTSRLNYRRSRSSKYKNKHTSTFHHYSLQPREIVFAAHHYHHPVSPRNPIILYRRNRVGTQQDHLVFKEETNCHGSCGLEKAYSFYITVTN
jgi:hypothetical protein